MIGLILSNQQLYEVVNDTIEDLGTAGLPNDARGLRDALSASSVGSEVLAAIRQVLRGIDPAGLDTNLRYQILSEITFLDSVLESSFR